MFINVPEYKGAGIYQIKNIQNGKIYIGQTTRNMRIRIQSHFNDLNRGVCKNVEFQEDFNMGCSFEIDVLYKLPKNIDHRISTAVESWYILDRNTYIDGYNRSFGAGTSKNKTASVIAISPAEYEESFLSFEESKTAKLRQSVLFKQVEEMASKIGYKVELIPAHQGNNL